MQMKHLSLFSLLVLFVIVGCKPHLGNEQNESLEFNKTELDSLAADETPVMIYDGEYCTRLLVYVENDKIIGDYDVKVQVKGNKLIHLELPNELGIDFDTYEPSEISQSGNAEILMDDGRLYKIQIVDCPQSNTNDLSVTHNTTSSEYLVENSITYSSNNSWAKDHFIDYFENEDIRNYISSAESDLENLKTDSEREEAKSIINFANSFINGGVVCLNDFRKSTELLGLNYNVIFLTEDLSIIKFKFGSTYFYFMRNINPNTGYSYTVFGQNGKLILMKTSRNVSCSYLSLITDGKVSYGNLYLNHLALSSLCLKQCL